MKSYRVRYNILFTFDNEELEVKGEASVDDGFEYLVPNVNYLFFSRDVFIILVNNLTIDWLILNKTNLLG